jgi:catecholate siderophore receptor
MTAARVPGSLRRPVAKVEVAGKRRMEGSTARLITAACLAAGSPATLALAQGAAPTTPLPPMSVESKQPKKKAATAPAKKSSGAPVAPAPAPAPIPPEQKSANPYANPDAPYKVERSASGKITQPLVNTPQTITTIPKEVIEDKAATSIRDLARQTPGVTLGFAEGGNAFGDAIYIRGFNARNQFYVDGLRDLGNGSREVFAVEQIEIYKGPGSVISGNANPGGAVNIITKAPNEKNNFANVSTMFGTDATIRTIADVNHVVSPGIAVRGSVMYHESEVAGRDITEDQRWGGFFAATFRPHEGFKLTLDYYRLRSDGIPDWGVPINRNTLVPWTENGLPRDTFFGNAMRDFIKQDAEAYTAKAEIKLHPDAKLTSITRFSTTDVGYVASLPQATFGPTVNVGNPQRLQDTESLAHQTELTVKFDTAGLRHTVVAGVEASKVDLERYGYTLLTTPPGGVPLFFPDPYRGLLNPALNTVGPPTLTYNATIENRAAYLLDTIKLSEQWFINGGIRFDHFERDQTSPNPVNNASRSDDLFNWHAGIVYKPIPIASVYAAVATSSNPVGAELDSTGVQYGGLTIGTSVLSPEKAIGYEIGTKWELFNKRVLATAALFQTDKWNARENTSACDNITLVCVAADTGAYRVRGIELGAQGNITKYWMIYGGYVWMDTEVTKSAVAANVGRRIANIPQQQFNLLTKYKVTDALAVGGQAIYSSEVYAGHLAAANNGYHTVPYWRFDVLAEYKFTQNFSATANVLNIFNETYYDALYQSDGANAFVAPGRVGYLTLNWKY